MRRRYKLVRIVDSRFFSANTTDSHCLEYRVGEITEAPNLGVACYKHLENATRPNHIMETKDFFNGGKPVAVLAVEPIGTSVYRDRKYRTGETYEGGINYRGVKVLGVAVER